MQKVRMLKTIRGRGGWLREGLEYDLEDRIVRSLISEGLVELALEDKAIHQSPSRAVVKRRRKT